jgi:hypothetical protein
MARRSSSLALSLLTSSVGLPPSTPPLPLCQSPAPFSSAKFHQLAVSHPFFRRKPNASHMCVRITISHIRYTHECNITRHCSKRTEKIY